VTKVRVRASRLTWSDTSQLGSSHWVLWVRLSYLVRVRVRREEEEEKEDGGRRKDITAVVIGALTTTTTAAAAAATATTTTTTTTTTTIIITITTTTHQYFSNSGLSALGSLILLHSPHSNSWWSTISDLAGVH